MVVRLTLTIAIVCTRAQRPQRQFIFKRDSPSTTAAGWEITCLTHTDCCHLMVVASVKGVCKRFDAKLVAFVFLNSFKFRICCSFSGKFYSHRSWKQKLLKPDPMERCLRVLLKATLGSSAFFAGLRHSGRKTNWCMLMPVLPKTLQTSRFGKLHETTTFHGRLQTTVCNNGSNQQINGR